MKVLLGFLLLCGLKEHVKSNSEENECVVNHETKGICISLVKCPTALNQIKNGMYPKICRYDGLEVVVCCPDCPSCSINSTTNNSTNQPARETLSGIIKQKAPGEISQAKCQEYAQYAFEALPFSLNSSKKILSCPLHEKSLILEGFLASWKEFPHMAQLGYQSEGKVSWLCSGALISPNFVLTAAHCLISRAYGAPISVRLGITNPNEETDHIQTRSIVEIYKHPQFTRRYHDIGLVRLDRDLILNVYVRPACLHTEKMIPKHKAIVASWSNNKYLGEVESEYLLKLKQQPLTVQECNSTLKRFINGNSGFSQGILDDYMICYGSMDKSKDTCQDITGSPLLIYHEETEDIKCMYSIIGVPSIITPCINLPWVYTRVSAYIEWIESIVWSQ